MNALFGDQVSRFGNGADDMLRVQQAWIRDDNRVRNNAGGEQRPQGRIDGEDEASCFMPPQIPDVSVQRWPGGDDNERDIFEAPEKRSRTRVALVSAVRQNIFEV